MSLNINTGMYEGYIYKIYNDINNKLYIGQTITTLNHRWNHYVTSVKNNINSTMIIHSAMKKYGIQNFHMVMVEKIEASNKKDLLKVLNKKEIEYIEKYKSKSPNGYNVTNGGNNISDKLRVPIDQYDEKGHLIAEHNSFSEACDALKLDYCRISALKKSCEGKSLSLILGYVWRYHGEPFDKFPVIVKHIKKSVDLYDLEGNYISTYKTIVNGLLAIGYSKEYCTHVTKCCEGKRAYALGYVWRYTGDSFDKYSCINKHCRQINCYDLCDNFIFTYNSSNEAGKAIKNDEKYHARANCIRACAAGKRPTMYGYKWFYANDPNQPDITKVIAC